MTGRDAAVRLAKAVLAFESGHRLEALAHEVLVPPSVTGDGLRARLSEASVAFHALAGPATGHRGSWDTCIALACADDRAALAEPVTQPGLRERLHEAIRWTGNRVSMVSDQGDGENAMNLLREEEVLASIDRALAEPVPEPGLDAAVRRYIVATTRAGTDPTNPVLEEARQRAYEAMYDVAARLTPSPEEERPRMRQRGTAGNKPPPPPPPDRG